MATYIVERGGGKPDLEIEATRVEQEEGTSRVQFFKADAAEPEGPAPAERLVGSFINLQGWYEKPTEA